MERNLHLQLLLDEFKGTVSQSNGAIFWLRKNTSQNYNFCLTWGNIFILHIRKDAKLRKNMPLSLLILDVNKKIKKIEILISCP
jgi:hypothetical protein